MAGILVSAVELRSKRRFYLAEKLSKLSHGIVPLSSSVG